MTRAYLGLAAFDVLCIATGFVLLFGCGFVRRRREVVAALGPAFFTGWATLSLALAVGACVGISPDTPRTIALAAAICIAGAALARYRAHYGSTTRPRTRLPGSGLVAAAGATVLAVALAAGVVVGAASPADVNWDAWAFWLPKAQAIYYFHGLDTGLGGYLSYAHPSYPPLMPVTSAAMFHFMAGVHPALLPLEQSLVAVGFVTSAAAILRPRVAPEILFPTLAMLVLAPEFWKRVPVVLPDQDTAYLLAAAALLCVLWLVEQHGPLLVPAGVFLGAAAMTKSEGFVLGLLLVAVILLPSVGRRTARRWGSLALFAGPAAVIPWWVWLAAHGHSTAAEDYDWRKLFDFGYLAGRGDRLSLAAGRLIHDVFAFGIWSLVLPLTLAACVLAARTAPRVAGALGLWLGVGFAGLTATYWIGFPEIHWYLNTSGERVIATLPLVGGTLLPLLLALAVQSHADAAAHDAARAAA